VGIDALRASIPKEVNEKSEQFGEIARETAERLIEAGATPVVVHHANKSEDDGIGVSRARGNSAIAAAFGGYLYLEARPKHGTIPALTLHQENRWGSPDDLGVCVDAITLSKGPSDATIPDSESDARLQRKPAPQRDRASTFLRDLLKQGPVEQVRVYQEGA